MNLRTKQGTCGYLRIFLLPSLKPKQGTAWLQATRLRCPCWPKLLEVTNPRLFLTQTAERSVRAISSYDLAPPSLAARHLAALSTVWFLHIHQPQPRPVSGPRHAHQLQARVQPAPARHQLGPFCPDSIHQDFVLSQPPCLKLYFLLPSQRQHTTIKSFP